MPTYNTNRMTGWRQNPSGDRKDGKPEHQEAKKPGKEEAKKSDSTGSCIVLCLLPILSVFFSSRVDDHAQGSAV
jgi:hypothetical protein